MQTKLTAKYKHGHQATVTHRHAHRHTWHASHLSLCQASITFPEPGSLLCVLPHRLPAACQHSVTQRNPIKQTTKVMDTRLKEDGWKLRWSLQGTKHTLRRWAKEQCQYLTERGRVGWGGEWHRGDCFEGQGRCGWVLSLVQDSFLECGPFILSGSTLQWDTTSRVTGPLERLCWWCEELKGTGHFDCPLWSPTSLCLWAN